MTRRKKKILNDKRLVMCSSSVDSNAITREVIDGIEHIIVSSYTLPDDVVMNGGLYPADEIAKSFSTLERTLAPVEHPSDSDGNFISASDPIAINNFYAGAFNVNVTRENGRVHIEKHINVQEAMKSDRGKRLIDRINEIETSDNPRPIHTSTGLFLEVEPTVKPMVNASGDEYTWVAKNMIFDHDAILLDSVGAAQPNQGVGMAVNVDGDKVKVERVRMELSPVDEAPQVSTRSINEQLEAQLRDVVAFEWLCIVDTINDQCIFETEKGYFQVPYGVDGETARIVGIPIRTIRTVTYSPKVNKEGDAMKELVLKALADAGIAVNAEISDDELMTKYNEFLQANQSQGDDDGATGDDLANIVANAVAKAVEPVTTKLESLQSEINANADAKKQGYIDTIVNSKKYPGVTAEVAKGMPPEALREMAANCGHAHGLPNVNTMDVDVNSAFKAPTEMPE